MTKGIAADFWFINQLTGNWLLVVVILEDLQRTDPRFVGFTGRTQIQIGGGQPATVKPLKGMTPMNDTVTYCFLHTWSTVEDSTRSNLVGKKGCNLSLLQTHNIVQRSVSKMISDSFQKPTGNPEKLRFWYFLALCWWKPNCSSILDLDFLFDWREPSS